MLKIFCFGYPRIYLNERPVTDFVSNKSLAVLLFAALNPGPQSRDTLTGMFWGDQPEKKARASFRSVLYNIRQLIGDYLITDRKSISFDATLPSFIDAIYLQNALSKKELHEIDIEAVRKGVELYRGPFFEGFFVSSGIEFENWVLRRRAAYESDAIKGLTQLAAYDKRQGKTDLTIDSLRQLVKIDALNESTQQELMLVLARMGEFNQAIAQFKIYKALLEKELDIEPMPGMLALYRKIVRARGLPRHNIPAESTPFIKRPALLKKILSTLQIPNNRIVTLLGTGG
ncbi:MAG: BTAD domain-containing putative transcriptional regulator, partial [Chloroflexota bacterium]